MRTLVCVEIENSDLVGDPENGAPLLRHISPEKAVTVLEADIVLYQGEIISNRHGVVTVGFPKVILP